MTEEHDQQPWYRSAPEILCNPDVVDGARRLADDVYEALSTLRITISNREFAHAVFYAYVATFAEVALDDLLPEIVSHDEGGIRECAEILRGCLDCLFLLIAQPTVSQAMKDCNAPIDPVVYALCAAARMFQDGNARRMMPECGYGYTPEGDCQNVAVYAFVQLVGLDITEYAELLLAHYIVNVEFYVKGAQEIALTLAEHSLSHASPVLYSLPQYELEKLDALGRRLGFISGSARRIPHHAAVRMDQVMYVAVEALLRLEMVTEVGEEDDMEDVEPLARTIWNTACPLLWFLHIQHIEHTPINIMYFSPILTDLSEAAFEVLVRYNAIWPTGQYRFVNDWPHVPPGFTSEDVVDVRPILKRPSSPPYGQFRNWTREGLLMLWVEAVERLEPPDGLKYKDVRNALNQIYKKVHDELNWLLLGTVTDQLGPNGEGVPHLKRAGVIDPEFDLQYQKITGYIDYPVFHRFHSLRELAEGRGTWSPGAEIFIGIDTVTSQMDMSVLTRTMKPGYSLLHKRYGTGPRSIESRKILTAQAARDVLSRFEWLPISERVILIHGLIREHWIKDLISITSVTPAEFNFCDESGNLHDWVHALIERIENGNPQRRYRVVSVNTEYARGDFPMIQIVILDEQIGAVFEWKICSAHRLEVHMNHFGYKQSVSIGAHALKQQAEEVAALEGKVEKDPDWWRRYHLRQIETVELDIGGIKPIRFSVQDFEAFVEMSGLDLVYYIWGEDALEDFIDQIPSRQLSAPIGYHFKSETVALVDDPRLPLRRARQRDKEVISRGQTLNHQIIRDYLRAIDAATTVWARYRLISTLWELDKQTGGTLRMYQLVLELLSMAEFTTAEGDIFIAREISQETYNAMPETLQKIFTNIFAAFLEGQLSISQMRAFINKSKEIQGLMKKK